MDGLDDVSRRMFTKRHVSQEEADKHAIYYAQDKRCDLPPIWLHVEQLMNTSEDIYPSCEDDYSNSAVLEHTSFIGRYVLPKRSKGSSW